MGIIILFPFGINYIFGDFETPETIITIEMKDSSTYYLDSPNKIIRAYVEIQNYTPSDGQYFMKITHLPTQNILNDSKIYPKTFENDLWAVQIAFPILEYDIKVDDQILYGEYEIKILTEFGSQTASTNFSILESSDKPSEESSEQPLEEIAVSNLKTESTSTLRSELSIDAHTDKRSYEDGETIMLTGEVSEILVGYGMSLMIFAPNDIVISIDQVTVGSDKKFNYELMAGGALMKTQGEYTIKLLYGNENTTKEIAFSYNNDGFTLPESADDSLNLKENTVEELIKEDQIKIDLLLEKGKESFVDFKYRTAETYFNQVLGIDSNNLEALNGKAKALAGLGNTNEAMIILDKAISIDSNFSKSYHSKGAIHLMLNQDNDALFYFDKALELDPKGKGSLIGKGSTLYYLGRYSESISTLEQALKIYPDNTNALFAQSLSFSSRDNTNDQFSALMNLNKVLEIDPGYPDAIHNKLIVMNQIAQDYDKDGDFENAISYFDQILEIDPDYSDALNNKEAVLNKMDESFVIDILDSLSPQDNQFFLQEKLKIQQGIAEMENQNYMFIILGFVVVGGIIGGLIWFSKHREKTKHVIETHKKIDPYKKEKSTDTSMEWKGI